MKEKKETEWIVRLWASGIPLDSEPFKCPESCRVIEEEMRNQGFKQIDIVRIETTVKETVVQNRE